MPFKKPFLSEIQNNCLQFHANLVQSHSKLKVFNILVGCSHQNKKLKYFLEKKVKALKSVMEKFTVQSSIEIGYLVKKLDPFPTLYISGISRFGKQIKNGNIPEKLFLKGEFIKLLQEESFKNASLYSISIIQFNLCVNIQKRINLQKHSLFKLFQLQKKDEQKTQMASYNLEGLREIQPSLWIRIFLFLPQIC